ncbi:MAG: hypothetical protein NWR30_06855 [Salibacteraceae bacterium]|jgi:hypothetical protein|nr:hypothetical protein [Salibacteraceae bacterium]MDP4934411.1 hypothetical protein [Salibacteraceae bacterium]
MVKSIVLLLNFVTFSFITFILSDGIKVTTNLPNEVIQDSVYTVEVIIDKGDVIGFAKFQQNLPPGFDVQPVEVADASFTYADGKVKFIWMAIPETEQVSISYTIKATADTPASSFAEGKFSYIDDMERKSFDLPNQSIVVKKEENLPIRLQAMAEITREVQSLGGNEYEVRLSISKQGITGFSKIEEFLPENYDAQVIENELSVFSQVDEKAKFVWMSIPSDEFLTVSYKVVTEDPNGLNSLKVMDGNFSYLDNNESKTVAIIGEEATEEPVVTAFKEEVNNEAVPETSAEIAISETIQETQLEDKSVAEESKENLTDSPQNNAPIAVLNEVPIAVDSEPFQMVKEDPKREEEPISASKTALTNVPAPENGISYKVQILAGHKVVTEKYIQKTYNFSESFVLDNHEGWVKYITGSYPDYKQARDKREDLIVAQHKFPGPFVTAYNTGERITVQEALMITNQQWIK